MPSIDEVNERTIKDQSVVIEEQLGRFVLFWNEWTSKPNVFTSLVDIQNLNDKTQT